MQQLNTAGQSMACMPTLPSMPKSIRVRWLLAISCLALAGCDGCGGCGDTSEFEQRGPGHAPVSCETGYLLDASGRCVRWRRVGALSEPRTWPTMLALDDKRVLFLGGSAEPEQGKDSSDPRSIHASGEVYDVARQAVATRFALTQRRGGAGAVRLKDGRVWVAGGYSKELNDLIHRDYQYTKTWDMLDVTATPMVVASGAQRQLHTPTNDNYISPFFSPRSS